jgi:hypothetical protein
MRTFILASLLLFASVTVRSQTLIGKWQLTKQSTCIESDLETDAETEDLVNEMKSRDSASPQVINFKDEKSGVESTRILSKRKEQNAKGFLYKFDGTNLHILDKKTQTILESYVVDKLDESSLIISNAARACDTKVFVRIK